MTYRIVRFHRNHLTEIIDTELTLAEAQEHCQHDDTKSADWFDGYEIEEQGD